MKMAKSFSISPFRKNVSRDLYYPPERRKSPSPHNPRLEPHKDWTRSVCVSLLFQISVFPNIDRI